MGCTPSVKQPHSWNHNNAFIDLPTSQKVISKTVSRKSAHRSSYQSASTTSRVTSMPSKKPVNPSNHQSIRHQEISNQLDLIIEANSQAKEIKQTNVRNGVECQMKSQQISQGVEQKSRKSIRFLRRLSNKGKNQTQNVNNNQIHPPTDQNIIINDQIDQNTSEPTAEQSTQQQSAQLVNRQQGCLLESPEEVGRVQQEEVLQKAYNPTENSSGATITA